ncbi:MAG: prolyl oligopeptidase family serine peptidase, partial [Planctomycetota bacterium]
MRIPIFLSVLAFFTSTPCVAQETAEPGLDLASITSLLAEAVDLPGPKARLSAARALAKRKDIALEGWEQAAQAFPPRGFPDGLKRRVLPGERMFEVEIPLTVLGETERTRLALFVPESYSPSRPHGLLVYLHGAGGNGAQMLNGMDAWARSLDLLILAPSDAGPNAGYSGRPREKAAVLEALRWMRRTYNVDENRVFLAGYSRGGHLTWDLVLRHPDLFAAAVPRAGAPRYVIAEGKNNLRYAQHLAHLPIRALIGEHEVNGIHLSATETLRRIQAAGNQNAELIIEPGVGHGVHTQRIPWKSFLDTAKRTARPDRVVRLFARPGEGRAFWLEVLKEQKGVKEEFSIRAPRGASGDIPAETVFQWVLEQGDDHTARAEAQWEEGGRITLQTKKVKKVRLRLSRDMLDEQGAVRVVWNGRTKKKKPKLSKLVLLSEFVERFDRSF